MTTKLNKSSKLKKPLLFLLISSFLVIGFVWSKIQMLSADPIGEKDCPPLDPSLVDHEENKNSLTVSMEELRMEWSQKGGFINDASCLNKTLVHGILKVSSEEDLKIALQYAKENDLKISMAGAKHSMGGHAFSKLGLVLDMTHFNQMSINEDTQILTVQSGAKWHDIQEFLHPNYAVKAMQSSDIFTVGGSISVNAHGMDHNVGSISNTIRSMRLMKEDGSIVTLSPTQNEELFNLVVGGYGLFGIILDVDLEVAENTIYETEREVIATEDFPKFFEEEVLADDSLGLFYGHLSTSSKNLLDEMIVYKYRTSEANEERSEFTIPPIEEVGYIKLRRLALNLSKKGKFFRNLKWFAEKKLEPMFETCSVTRGQAMSEGEACLISRNEPMHDSVKYINNNLKNDTDILHEYFIPRENFIPFVDGMREIFSSSDLALLNASVRVAHEEKNFLNYSPQESFSIVLYINQSTDEEGNRQMKELTQKLIDLTHEQGGKFFLPYQPHYTSEQLVRAYPNMGEFFDQKRKHDPNEIFFSTFYKRASSLTKDVL